VSEASELTPDRAFGAESRRSMLDDYFATAGLVSTDNAWQHVYRLLLWIDRTTGLAHCYESDKAQPGRPWYGRSLAFHAWVASQLGAPPAELGLAIDVLFTKGAERLAQIVLRTEAIRAVKAAEQRTNYNAGDFPEPGDDPKLESMIAEELSPFFSVKPSQEVLRRLTRRVREYTGQENKRKNLVGEGFEDVLAALIQRLPGGDSLKVMSRLVLHAVPGFRPPPTGEKSRKVDLAVTRADESRVLVSAKWSVRADREEQFKVDFDTYSRLEDAGRDFDFVLITNEFDAARLVAACGRRAQNSPLFSRVVHVNPEGPLTAYGLAPRDTVRRLITHIKDERLISLKQWLESLDR